MELTDETSTFCDSCDTDRIRGVTIRLEKGVPLLPLCLRCFGILKERLAQRAAPAEATGRLRRPLHRGRILAGAAYGALSAVAGWWLYFSVLEIRLVEREIALCRALVAYRIERLEKRCSQGDPGSHPVFLDKRQVRRVVAEPILAQLQQG